MTIILRRTDESDRPGCHPDYEEIELRWPGAKLVEPPMLPVRKIKPRPRDVLADELNCITGGYRRGEIDRGDMATMLGEIIGRMA